MDKIEDVLKRVDQVISDFVNNPHNKIFIENLNRVSKMGEAILEQPEIQNLSPKWSKEISLGDSVENVFEFLKSVDKNFANQFMNLISDLDNNVYISKKECNADENRVDMNGNVFIYYDNSPEDMFVILHEILHKMNQTELVDVDEAGHELKGENYVRSFLGETVSFMGEAMLAQWLIEKGIITENDNNIIKRNRLNSSKQSCRRVLIEHELIKLKLQNKEINQKDLLDMLKNMENPFLAKVCEEESRTFNVLNDIGKTGNLKFMFCQRYVIAQYLYESVFTKEDSKGFFLRLNEYVGYHNAKMKNVEKGFQDEEFEK